MNRTMKQIHEWIPQNRLGGVGYDIGPKAAYGTWSGGTLGVLARQMDGRPR